jgi:hypothetical protein
MLSASPIPPGITPDHMHDMFNRNNMQTHVTDKALTIMLKKLHQSRKPQTSYRSAKLKILQKGYTFQFKHKNARTRGSIT